MHFFSIFMYDTILQIILHKKITRKIITIIG